MKLECTKKLLDYLGVKPEKAAESTDTLYAWTANLITVNRRKTLVAIHVSSRCMFVLHGLTAKAIPKMPDLIRSGIRALLQSEYVRPEIIDKYLDDCCREVGFVPNSSRSAVAACNKACERVQFFTNVFEAGDLLQQDLLPMLNYDLIPKQNYAYSYDLLIACLKERYGEAVQVCRGVELEVELKLHNPCKRRILVPDNINFYQLHAVLQGIFEWHDRHLHQFVLEYDRNGIPLKIIQPADVYSEDLADLHGTEYLDSVQVTVRDVFEACKPIGYEYDFGDGWLHEIRLRRFVEDCPHPWPHCIQAIGDAPMEDSGGPDGFAWITQVLKDPTHPEHKDISGWVRSSWWQPLNVELINRRIKAACRRKMPLYYE